MNPIEALEEMAETSDAIPHCPVKMAELELIAPVPVDDGELGEDRPDPRYWKYRVC